MKPEQILGAANAVASVDERSANDACTSPECSFAFQPIYDIEEQSVFSFEALIRGTDGQPAWQILEAINPAEFLEYDQLAREKALSLAAGLSLSTNINLNFTPAALLQSGDYIQRTLDKAVACGLNAEQVIVEVTETEAIEDKTSFTAIVNQFRGLGIKLAIDDFGAGFSGLNLLASFQPDLVKLDMELVRNIDSQGPRQAIVAAIIRVCFELGIDIIAEGVETVAEFEWLRSHGVELFQGYLFAKPMFEGFPSVFDPSNI